MRVSTDLPQITLSLLLASAKVGRLDPGVTHLTSSTKCGLATTFVFSLEHAFSSFAIQIGREFSQSSSAGSFSFITVCASVSPFSLTFYGKQQGEDRPDPPCFAWKSQQIIRVHHLHVLPSIQKWDLIQVRLLPPYNKDHLSSSCNMFLIFI